jgi:hypothetical protein
MSLPMASTSVLRLAVRPPISSCLRSAFKSTRRAPLSVPAVQSGCAKSAFSTTSVWRNQPGHEEETFEEFSARYMSFQQSDIPLPPPLGRVDVIPGAVVIRRCSMKYKLMLNSHRYEKEFDSVQDVFELQVCCMCIHWNGIVSADLGYGLTVAAKSQQRFCIRSRPLS